jgi:hypothetical protein
MASIYDVGEQSADSSNFFDWWPPLGASSIPLKHENNKLMPRRPNVAFFRAPSRTSRE